MLIMHRCQPLVLIFQFFKIFEQRTSAPSLPTPPKKKSLNPGFISVYNSNSCIGGECGHYIQVVWVNSLRIECAKVRCNNGGTFIVYNYDPPCRHSILQS